MVESYLVMVDGVCVTDGAVSRRHALGEVVSVLDGNDVAQSVFVVEPGAFSAYAWWQRVGRGWRVRSARGWLE